MKRLILLLAFAVALSTSVAAVDTVSIKSKVKAATIYPAGAQVFRTTTAQLNKGKHAIKFVDLYHNLDIQSIQVEDINNCKIISVKPLRNYTANDKPDPERQKYSDSIDVLNNINKKIGVEITVLKEQEKLLMDNKDFTDSKEGTRLNELKEALQFYSDKFTAIKLRLLELSAQIEDNARLLQKYKSKLQEKYNRKDDGTYEILVVVESLASQKAEINFNYYIHEAGWKPLYDFRLINIMSPLRIDYKANIYQTTGYDWKGIDLKLATVKPSKGGTQKELEKWYVDEYKTSSTIYNAKDQDEVLSDLNSGALKGVLTDEETGEPIPFANIVVETGGQQITGATTDFDGNFTIKPLAAGRYDIKATYVGYKTVMVTGVVIAPNKTTYQNMTLKSSMQQLDCVEMVSYKVPLISKDDITSGGVFTSEEIGKMSGRISFGIPGIITKKHKINYDNSFQKINEDNTFSFNNNLTIPEKDLKRNFEIQGKQDVPSSKEPFTILIKEENVSSDYIFTSIPKLQEEAYLIANVPDWTKLELISGKANIFLEGTFVGETFVDINKISDTLSISLGRDNKTLVKREVQSKYDDKNSIGPNYSKIVDIEIQVQNLRDMPVKVTLDDQYPLSYRKSIKVDLDDDGGAEIDEEEGKLTWKLDLQPKETKKLKFAYSVKYPKNMNLELEK